MAEGLDGFIKSLGAAGALAAPVTAAMSAFTSLASPVTAATSAFTGLSGAIIPLVEAFAPSAVLAFNEAMRDTSAVVGSALLPVLNVMTDVVRHVGDALAPVMQKLAPIMQTLSDVVGKIVVVWVNTFATALSGFADAVKPLLPILEGMGALSQAWATILGGLINVMTEFWAGLAGAAGGGAANLKNAFESLAKAAILAVGALAKFFGADAALRGMIKALGGGVTKGGSTGYAAPKNVQITDAMTFNRGLATAAFSAQGDVGISKDEQWQKDSKKLLEGILDGTVTTAEAFTTALGEAKDAIKELAAAVKAIKDGGEDIKKGSNQAAGVVTAPQRYAEEIGRDFGRWVRAQINAARGRPDQG